MPSILFFKIWFKSVSFLDILISYYYEEMFEEAKDPALAAPTPAAFCPSPLLANLFGSFFSMMLIYL